MCTCSQVTNTRRGETKHGQLFAIRDALRRSWKMAETKRERFPFAWETRWKGIKLLRLHNNATFRKEPPTTITVGSVHCFDKPANCALMPDFGLLPLGLLLPDLPFSARLSLRTWSARLTPYKAHRDTFPCCWTLGEGLWNNFDESIDGLLNAEIQCFLYCTWWPFFSTRIWMYLETF